MSTPLNPGTGGPGLVHLTASQREVVRSTAQRLLVGAGAGSGKTSTVVQMVCHLLGASVTDAEGTTFEARTTLQLGQIAAITFTNQAAADLKRKLRQALKLSGLAHIAADVDSARIGTIHGFCGDLLREFALRAGLRPSVTVINEMESLALGGACAELALTEAVESRDPTWLEPLVSGRRIRDVARFIQMLAADTARLDAYAANRAGLRTHEERLLDLAIRAVEIRRIEMVEQGLYDFDSLLVVTRDLLRDRHEVRHAIQRRIRVLIVDEFQDVDPVQRDIAMLLGGLDTGDPNPSRVILVGDPKQSIFRFRRADVTLWNGVAARFGSAHTDGAKAELSDNFRSRKGILALVDRVFGSALDGAVSPDGERRAFEVDYVALHASAKHAEGDECVELRCVPAHPDGKQRSAGEVRRLEAQDVAARIWALHADGCAFGDIAMLLAGWGDVDLYESALRSRGIPVYVLRGEGFWEAREIIDCLLALRAIRDSGTVVVDQAALVGFLKSPFVGVRDDTLLALAEHQDGWRAAMQAEPRERALLDRACVILERFGALRDRMPLGELLQRLITETGFLAAVSLDPSRGAQAVGNLRKLIRLAAESGDSSLGEWLREVEEERESGAKEAQERLYRERADVVTITSIHSAKGLEWPVVFWCDMVRGSKAEGGSLLDGRELFRLKDPSLLDDDREPNDEVFDDFAAQLALERQAESYRLWYVAATRPQQLLVLSGIALASPKAEDGNGASDTAKVPRFSGSPADLIRQSFARELEAPGFPDVIHYSHDDGTVFRMLVSRVAGDAAGAAAVSAADDAIGDAAVRTAAAAGGTAVGDAAMVTRAGAAITGADAIAVSAEQGSFIPPRPIVAKSGKLRLSATQLMQFTAEPDVWWSRHVRRLDLDEPLRAPDAPDARGSGSALSGTIVHDGLEHFGAETTDLETLIAAALARHAGGNLDAAQREALRTIARERVSLVINHPRWNEIAGDASTRRELTFTRVLPDGSTIEGAFDLAAVLEGQTCILDVKSGKQTDAASLASAYAMQAATYQEAATAIAGDRPTTFELLQAADGMVVSVPDTPGAALDAVERLRAYRGSSEP